MGGGRLKGRLSGRNDKEQTDGKRHSKQLPLMSPFFLWSFQRQRHSVVEFGNDNDVNFRRLPYPGLPLARAPGALHPVSKQLQNKGHGLQAPAAQSTLNVGRIKNTQISQFQNRNCNIHCVALVLLLLLLLHVVQNTSMSLKRGGHTHKSNLPMLMFYILRTSKFEI